MFLFLSKIAFLEVFFWFWLQNQCLYLAPFSLAALGLLLFVTTPLAIKLRFIELF